MSAEKPRESIPVEEAFVSEFNTTLLPLENPKIIGIIEQFIIDFQRDISEFLRKKTQIEFQAVNICEPKHFRTINAPSVIGAFQLSPQSHYGLLHYNLQFLHTVINLLFGGANLPNEPIMQGLGKSGPAIAQKITNMALQALEAGLQKYLALSVEPEKVSDMPGLVLNYLDNTPLFDFAFTVILDGIAANFHIALPEMLVESLSEPDSNAPSDAPAHDPSILETRRRNELIDSAVTISAVLPAVKVHLQDVLKLKPGDTIPIADPNEAYLMLNNKRLFRVVPGKANESRVVKIEDTL